MIEEARTEALIRTCNKCKVRILKEDGCNKVICTSCYAVLCDYCGKDITKAMYNHFDSESGRAPPGLITKSGGKCPLYDESNKRKDDQVEAAEKEAMAKVRSDHPELSEEDLRIKFAKSVQQSSSKRHDHFHRHRPWIPPQPPFLHPPPRIGYGDPAPFLRPANLADAIPGAFPAADEEQQRQLHLQQLQRRQQVAYQTYVQAQQRQQQMQAQHQQILAEQQQQLNQMRLRQQTRLVQQAQVHIDQAQARVHANFDRNREVFGENAAAFGADGAFGFNAGPEDNAINQFQPIGYPDRYNQPNHLHHFDGDPLVDLQTMHPPNPEDVAARARRLTELQTPEPYRPRRQLPEPTRRNALVPNYPWE